MRSFAPNATFGRAGAENTAKGSGTRHEDVNGYFTAVDGDTGSMVLNARREPIPEDEQRIPGHVWARRVFIDDRPETVTAITLASFGVPSVRSLWGPLTLAWLEDWTTASALPIPLQLVAVQHYGTGGTPSDDVETVVARFTRGDSAWTPRAYRVAVPPPTGTVGTNGDDELRIELRLDFSPANNAAVPGALTLLHGPVMLRPGHGATADALDAAPQAADVDTGAIVGDLVPRDHRSQDVGADGNEWGAFWGTSIRLLRNAILEADSNDILHQRRGTNPQEFRVSNTWTDPANNEYATIRWSGNWCVFGTASSGTGAQRPLQLQAGSQPNMDLQPDHTIMRRRVRFGDDVEMPHVPTSDPTVAGRLWNDGGTLKISAG